MRAIDMSNHSFGKINLVTLSGGGDQYRCSVCGCVGIRKTLSNDITLTEAEYKKASKCTFRPKKVTHNFTQVLTPIIAVDGGVDAGWHDVVPCPTEYEDKYGNDVWIHSNTGLAVRILSHEIYEKK